MLLEIRVIGDDAESIKNDITFLAAEFGVVTGEVAFEAVSDLTIVGTATGERRE